MHAAYSTNTTSRYNVLYPVKLLTYVEEAALSRPPLQNTIRAWEAFKLALVLSSE